VFSTGNHWGLANETAFKPPTYEYRRGPTVIITLTGAANPR